MTRWVDTIWMIYPITPYGWKLFSATNWYGNIDLRTPAERAIFEGYLSRSW